MTISISYEYGNILAFQSAEIIDIVSPHVKIYLDEISSLNSLQLNSKRSKSGHQNMYRKEIKCFW